jgi:hypothetical protein
MALPVLLQSKNSSFLRTMESKSFKISIKERYGIEKKIFFRNLTIENLSKKGDDDFLTKGVVNHCTLGSFKIVHFSNVSKRIGK